MDGVKLFVCLLTISIMASGDNINITEINVKNYVVTDSGIPNRANLSTVFDFTLKMSKEEAKKWLIKKIYCEDHPKSLWCQPGIESDFPDPVIPKRSHCFNATSHILCVLL